METPSKALPLVFNKVFFLSEKEPSSEIKNNNNFLYCDEAHENIKNCIKEFLPPLFLIEKYYAFWLNGEFSYFIGMFD